MWNESAGVKKWVNIVIFLMYLFSKENFRQKYFDSQLCELRQNISI